MLEDRDYMRQSSSGWRWSATLTLVVTLIVAFILQITVLKHSEFSDYLPLSLEGIKHGFVWQLLTFQFLHGGWLHLLFNCWTLYMFGREVEWTLGKARFLILYFSSGVVGGLFQVLVSLLWPNYFGGPVVGASAGIFGLVAAFAMLFPERMLTMLVFFIIPVNMRAKMLLFISLLITALGIAFPAKFGSNVAHAAHLGGILTGMAFVRFGGALRRNFWNPMESRRRKRELIRAGSIRLPQWPRSKSDNPADLPEEEFISREVDPILDKISQHGIQSLSERERKILEAARNKMAKK
jgi:membrane associated rhomboid family serine protease